MKVGFTGTQRGMLEDQRVALRVVLNAYAASELHHGDCIGSDVEARDLAQGMAIATISHPPKSEQKRAFTSNSAEREPLPYLERNRAIVNETEMLVATPRTTKEQVRSGTWYTIRYARKLGRQVIIIYPGGNIQSDNPSVG